MLVLLSIRELRVVLFLEGINKKGCKLSYYKDAKEGGVKILWHCLYVISVYFTLTHFNPVP